jgi:hypothetical protein
VQVASSDPGRGRKASDGWGQKLENLTGLGLLSSQPLQPCLCRGKAVHSILKSSSFFLGVVRDAERIIRLQRTRH